MLSRLDMFVGGCRFVARIISLRDLVYRVELLRFLLILECVLPRLSVWIEVLSFLGPELRPDMIVCDLVLF